MRNIPTAPPLPGPSQSKSTTVTEVRTYRFITHVIGGGVTPQQPDRVTPIRAPSIRGQLRFWWRAVNPRGCQTLVELREAETDLFGGVSGVKPRRSQLTIAVSKQPREAKAEAIFVDGDQFKVHSSLAKLAYGAFPLRDSEKARLRHGKLYLYQDEFELTFQFPEALAPQVHSTLWAWTHFGGLGARTRRGFGAIRQVNGPRVGSPFADFWKYVRESANVDVPWPHLRKPPIKGQATPTTRQAHELLLTKLQQLRQAPGLGRNPGQDPKRPGRSRWPEADEVRRRTGRHASGHEPDPKGANGVFPRAAFGLPIVLHFKDENAGDPKGVQLHAVNLDDEVVDRWGSPLIIRPYQDDGGACFAMAVCLGGAIPRVAVTRDKQDRVRQELGERAAIALPHDAAQRIRPLAVDGKLYLDPIERYLEEIR